MVQISDEDFDKLISEAIDSMPERYLEHLDNVAIIAEDIPTEEQRVKLHLYRGQTLYGLYEGIPLTRRGTNYSMVLPDKITIFREPIKHNSQDLRELKIAIRTTVWHEIAHFYGLNHDQIYAIERKMKLP